MSDSSCMASATLATCAGVGGGAWPISPQGGNAFRRDKWHSTVAGSSSVVIVCGQGCCMSHVVTQLLYSLGANSCVLEVVPDHKLSYEHQQELPAIFVGGRLLGGLDKLLAAHISGNLIPQLKEAGALWL
ncbi:hypothetical protein KP509_18G005000 [Ceratopteris richardii]|uniref:Glutaredoxin n=1 Tax=Ceratopteris richardii TaxID=49495 RepID=A0A8T2SMB4_CERRI|nr:hypothetical protein KP509_18G005000 [Ceratopteris richardii]